MNKGHKILSTCLAALVLPLMAVSQKSVKEIPRDTSYTVYQTFIKEQKKFPTIEIVNPSSPQKVTIQKDVVYATIKNSLYGNRDLHLDLLTPKDTKSRGVVILLHGGGWSSGNKSQMIPMAEVLAINGYVAAAVEYRLSPEATYPAAAQDVKTAVQWIRANAKKYEYDPDKIAILGCSAGAQLAALVATNEEIKPLKNKEININSSTINAVVSIDGIVSFIHPEASAEGDAATRWLDGSRTDAAENWKNASPLEYVNENTPPFLFINSIIPRYHAGRDDLLKKLSEYGTYSEVHTITNSPHSFWFFTPWFEPTCNYVLGFLDRIFKN